MITKQALEQFIGTECYWSHPFFKGIVYTDGVKYLFDNGAAWLGDVVMSHMKHTPRLLTKSRGMLFITLSVNADRSANVVAQPDIDEPALFEQEIPYTDYPLQKQQIWASYSGDNWVLYLPSEH